MHGWSSKIQLEAKSMLAKFDVGAKNFFFAKILKHILDIQIDI